MQHNLRLLSVAAGCALSFAIPPAGAGEPRFAEPTFYGRINLTVEDARVGGADADTDLVDNGSRLGVRGGGDLANGIQGIYQIEIRLKNFPDGAAVRSRDTWFGLRGDGWGELRLGMMEGPLFRATYDEISMHNHNSGRSEDKLLAESATGGRMKKSVYYKFPLSAPLKLEVLHAFLEKDPAKTNAAHPSHDESRSPKRCGTGSQLSALT